MKQSNKPSALLVQYPLLWISVVCIFLFLWSWQQWADPLIDSGQNFYVFWQLSLGKKLYKDIAYFHGPFSAGIGGLIFYFFGPSLKILAIIQTSFIALTSWMIYRIFLLICPPFSSFFVSILFLFLFCFSQYTGIANYNFVLPYKFEAAHGTALIIGMIFLYTCFQETKKKIYLLLCGVAWGATLLTSAEIALTSTSIFLIFLFFDKKNILLAIIASATIPLIFLSYFLFFFPPWQSVKNTFYAISTPLLNENIRKNVFFNQSMGIDMWKENLFMMLLIAASSMILYLLSSHAMKKWLKYESYISMAIPFCILIFFIFYPQWSLLRAIPIFCLFYLIWNMKLLFQPHRLDERILFIWSVFSTFYILKIFFFARIYHYGFYLAMPACLLLFSFFAKQLAWRKASYFVAAALIIYFFSVSSKIYQQKTVVIGYGENSIRAFTQEIDHSGLLLDMSLDWIEKNISPSESLLTLPEGNILNFLSKRMSPIPFTMNYVEYMAVGEEKILQEIEKHPPDFIALVQRDSNEFGVPPFGSSEKYGKRTMDWISKHYRIEKLIGAMPFRSAGFGILLLKSLSL